MKKAPPFHHTPYYVLGLLFTINLVNYLDRQVLYALLPLIKVDLQLSDAQLGALASAFMLVYMCAAPFVGYLADRSSRKNWISAGIAIWSVATFASGLTRNYFQLFAARAAVGIGESGYGAVSPSFVAEYFTPEKRGRVLAFFSMAIPVGSALGYIAGGWIGYHYSWRTAFMFVGAPGLLLALLAYFLRDPREGDPAPSSLPRFSDYLSLYRIRSYVASTLAMAALTFALGGLAVWMPTFLIRFWGLNVAEAGTLFGGITVVAGLFGCLAGGWIADWLLKTTGKAYFIVSGAGLMLAMPTGILAIMSNSYPLTLTALFFTEFFAFLNMGPLNGVIVNVTSSSMRSMAFAANIFVIHALGDALSPTLIGIASDHWGLKPAMVAAMMFLGLAGIICIWGTRAIEEDTAHA